MSKAKVIKYLNQLDDFEKRREELSTAAGEILDEALEAFTDEERGAIKKYNELSDEIAAEFQGRIQTVNDKENEHISLVKGAALVFGETVSGKTKMAKFSVGRRSVKAGFWDYLEVLEREYPGVHANIIAFLTQGKPYISIVKVK